LKSPWNISEALDAKKVWTGNSNLQKGSMIFWMGLYSTMSFHVLKLFSGKPVSCLKKINFETEAKDQNGDMKVSGQYEVIAPLKQGGK